MDFIHKAKSAIRQLGGGNVPTLKETLTEEQFSVSETVRHGFPRHATALAVDPVQGLLAIGNRTGHIAVLGKPGVESFFSHDGEKDSGIMHLSFLVNEGALLSLTANNTLHLWNLRQKNPAIVQSVEFSPTSVSTGGVTCLCAPLKSGWVYVGTEAGNVFPVSVESFQVSGYTIYWNHVIELSQKQRPGAVHSVNEHPSDSSKLLLTYDFLAVVWDLRAKTVLFRCQVKEAIRSVSWLSDGKQFMTGHRNGSLTVWNAKDGKLVNTSSPHARDSDSSCHAVRHLQWLSSKEHLWVLFTGGLPLQDESSGTSITVLTGGGGLFVLNFDGRVVDFRCLTSTPFADELQEPHTVVVLLEESLEVVDLLSPGHARYNVPYSTTLSSSPVTTLLYEGDIPSDFYGQVCSVGTKNIDELACSKRWPIKGGLASDMVNDVYDLLLTGHADGGVRFWDISSVCLSPLYSLKTSSFFEPYCVPPSPSLSQKQPEVSEATSEQQQEQQEPLSDVAENSQAVRQVESPGSNQPQAEHVSQPSDKEDQSQHTGTNAPSQSPDHQKKEEGDQQESKNQQEQCEDRSSEEKLSKGGNKPISPDADAKEFPRQDSPNATDAVDAPLENRTNCDTVEAGLAEKEVEYPFAVHQVSLCTESNQLVVSSQSSYVLLCSLSMCAQEVQVPTVQVCLESGCHSWGGVLEPGAQLHHSMSSMSQSSDSDMSRAAQPESIFPLRWSTCRDAQIQSPGFHATLCVQLVTSSGSIDTSPVSCLQYSHGLGLLAIGSGSGLCVVDVLQKKVLLCSPVSVIAYLSAQNHKHRRTSEYSSGHEKEHQEKSPAPLKSTKRKSFFTKSMKSKSKQPSVDTTTTQPTGEVEPVCISKAGQPVTSGQWITEDQHIDAVSELENAEHAKREAVECLQFVSTFFAKDKDDSHLCPSLWFCTSAGNVFGLSLRIALPTADRPIGPVVWDGRASVIDVAKAPLATLAMLDHEGLIMSPPSTSCRFGQDSAKQEQAQAEETSAGGDSKSEHKCHFLVTTSEKRAFVYALPSQARSKRQFPEGTLVIKSCVIGVAGGACLVSLTVDARLVVFSLPNLSPLMDFPYNVPEMSMFRMVRTFACAHGGQALYMSSPSQMQRLSLLAENVLGLPDTLPDVQVVKQLPGRAQKGFFSSFFSSTPEQLDRDELFGRNKSGVASQSVATRKVTPGGMQGAAFKAGTAAAALSKARQELDERGEKLSELTERTAHMSDNALEFSRQCRALAEKYENQPWWKIF